MSIRIHRSFFSLFVLGLLLGAHTLHAGQKDAVAGRLSRGDLRVLRQLPALSGTGLQEISESTAPGEIEADVREILRDINLSLGYRPQGARTIHDWLETRLTPLRDLVWLGEIHERVPVPVPLDQAVSLSDRENRETRLEVGDTAFEISPFWPNGALPNLTPEEGLTGPLVYIRDGEWEELDGLDPREAIVLMNFRGGRNWNRAMELGAKAAIVIEDPRNTNRVNAERFFTNTPLPFPRFMVNQESGEALIALSERKVTQDNETEILPGHTATLRGGNWIENRLARSKFAWIPPHDSLEMVVRDTDLIDRIAAQFGLEASDLIDENQLDGPVLEEGQELLIPGQLSSYTVGKEDLLNRLLREYQVELDDLLELSGPIDRSLPAGTVLQIPPLGRPMVVNVRLEALSTLPGLPHGSNTAANISVAVRLLEMVDALPAGARRRGLLVAFLEGDAHGGRASRRLLESFLIENEHLEPAAVTATQAVSDDEIFDRYLEIDRWLKNETQTPDKAAIEWFVDEWLADRLDQHRVALAEMRVDAIRRGTNNPEDRPVTRQIQARMLEKIDRVVEVRASTLNNEELSYPDRAKNFLNALHHFEAAEQGDPQLDRESLQELFFLEVAEEKEIRALSELNSATTQKVLDVLRPAGEAIPLDRPRQGWWLDLSSGSPHMEFAPNRDYRGVEIPSASNWRSMVERFDRVQSFAALQAGWAEDWTFIGNDVHAVFPLLSIPPPPSYAELWARLGVTLIPLRAANDNRNLIDTHLDVPDHFDFDQFSTLARTAMLLFRVNIESARDGNPPGNISPQPVSRLIGTTTRFNIRSGIDARDPVPNTLVYFPAIRTARNLDGWGNHNTATYMGNRIGVMQFSLMNGRYALPVELHNFAGQRMVFAYQLNERTGLFSSVMDGGQIGTSPQSYGFSFVENRDSFKNLIMYQLYPFVISPGVEPLQYSTPTDEGSLPQIQDAVLRGAPRNFNLEHPRIHFGESEVEGMIIYMEPLRRIIMLDIRQGRIRGLLLGELDQEDPTNLQGRGIEIGPTETSRNLVFPMAAYRIAKDMQNVSERRMKIYEAYGFRDQELSTTLELSREKLNQVEKYIDAHQWQHAVGTARESWGMLVKNYPSILMLGREAILSVVILMGLLAPTSVFLEKLIIGGKHILAKLGGTVLIFILGTLFLNFFHPAFRIALSPFIVVIAFTMILMAIVVLGICYQRFEVLVRRARIQGGEAESEEISLMSSLSTAFSLGVSNLKKRPTRTLLTSFTVTVLTFSIVSFVSVRGLDTLFMRPIELDNSIQGVEIPREALIPPPYDGILFRGDNWSFLQGDFMDAIRTEFGSRFQIARRAHYIEVAGGNNAALEGRNQIEIRGADESDIVTALMAFEPVETEFTGLHRAVSHQHWFRGESEEHRADRLHIIIPRRVANVLGIDDADLVDDAGERLPDEALPQVRMMSQNWRVIGILDAEHADRIRDVNGNSPALVDYLRSAITPNIGAGALETEEEHEHMSFDDLALVPVNARTDVRAGWSSLAVRFPDDFDFEAFRQTMALRMDRAMYAHVDGDISLLSARKEQSVGGLAKVVVPIILCILIVSNTMMGTVDERVSEVQMLGAIGLSPSQISFLLLSESTVFSCIGIIFGTFSGLLFSQVVGFFPETLGQLSFNFTSLASTFLAMGTGGIVLLATLIPAKKAAALAAPSGMDKWKLPDPEEDGSICFKLPFTLTRGNAIGMAAFFRRFLLNHVDSSSSDFISKGAAMSSEAAETGMGLRVTCHMWLAPYDLDVAQDMDLHIDPTENEGVFGVTIVLKRSSGTEDAWMRTNYGFLDLVRKQFLLWRNLEPSMRKRYIQEGTQALEGNEAA